MICYRIFFFVLGIILGGFSHPKSIFRYRTIEILWKNDFLFEPKIDFSSKKKRIGTRIEPEPERTGTGPNRNRPNRNRTEPNRGLPVICPWNSDVPIHEDEDWVVPISSRVIKDHLQIAFIKLEFLCFRTAMRHPIAGQWIVTGLLPGRSNQVYGLEIQTGRPG